MNKYYSGQGSLYVAERDPVSGAPRGFIPLGNVPELTISIETTQVDHKESESGNRLIDLVLVTEKKGTFSFNIESLNLDNLALGFWGSNTAVVAGTVAEPNPEIVTIQQGDVGVRYALQHPKVSTVVVKDETGVTTYVAGTDYSIDADNGVIVVLAGGAIATDVTAGDTILEVTYAYAGYSKLDAFTDVVPPERWLRFEGINTVDGKKVIVDLFRAQFAPLTDYGLINEELGSGTLSGQLLADTLRPDGTSQFFRQLDLA